MPSPETQSSNEQFDHRLEKGEQKPSGEKLELSLQEKEQGVHERIEDWHKTHDLPHNLSDIESQIEDIENSIKQLEVIAHTSEFAKEEIQRGVEKEKKLKGLKNLLKEVGRLATALGVAAGVSIGNPSDANAFYQQGNLETAGEINTENTTTREGQGNTEEEDTENKDQVNQQEESDDLLWGSEQESSAPENNLDNQEPLEEQDLTQEEDVSVETTQEISSESEQESAFVKQAQELLKTAQERESQYLDTIQGIVTAIEEQALTEPEMEEAISLGERFLRLEELSNQDEQEDDGGEEQEL